MRNKIYFFLIILVIFALSGFFVIKADKQKEEKILTDIYTEENRPKYKMGKVIIRSIDGKEHEIKVEIADKGFYRSFGLMYVKSMPEENGMLFIFPDEAVRNFWMKNTFIPLDIIYVGSDLEVKHVAKNTVPHSLEMVNSIYPAQYAIEVNAGISDKLGVTRGDKIEIIREKNNFEN